MPYSMVGTPALGYDLARRPHGAQAAVVVRTALRADRRELRRLAARHRGPEQYTAPALTSPEQVSETLPLAGEAMAHALANRTIDSARALHRLESAVLGSLEAFDRFLRSEVLDWIADSAVPPALVATAAQAADVLRDAAAAAFCDDIDPRRRRQLAAGFVGAGLTLVDSTVPTGHQGVDALLAAVADSGPTQRDAWRSAVERSRPATADWAPAMHQATWALHVSDRLRLAGDAQMAAVLAFVAGGFTAQDASYGVWNALSGAVHATLVEDLLGGRDLDLLTTVLRLAC